MTTPDPALMALAEFSARFKARMLSVAGPTFADGDSIAEYADETAPTYFETDWQREEGPEACMRNPPMSDDLLKLAALADRVEAATGADRQMDADIAKALGETILHEPGDDWFILCMGGLGRRAVPAYTASLDAAMTLVPEGCTWRLDYLAARHGDASVGSAFVISPPASGELRGGDAATPPLALCAAALRARSAA